MILCVLIAFSVTSLAVNAYVFLFLHRSLYLYIVQALLPLVLATYPLSTASWVTKQYHWTKTTKKSLYYTLIYPYLTYCTTVWSSTYVTNLNRIFLLQKRAVRIITNADFRAHSEPLFFRLKILDIYNINSFYTAQFMFSYYHQLLPPLFSNLFVTSSNIHNYNTRSSSHFRSHACRTNTKQFSILFQGPKIWNSLPNSVTSIFTLQSFKTKVFDFLLYR